MRRSVAMLLTLCLMVSTVEALLGAVQHARVHTTGARAAAPAASQQASLPRTAGDEATVAAVGDAGADAVVLPRHGHHDEGDPAPPAGGHCAHFHTVAPVGFMASDVPTPALASRQAVETTVRPRGPSLPPLTQPPRA